MASAALLRNSINGFKNLTRVPFSVRATHNVANLSLTQPFLAKKLTTRSQDNPLLPEFQFEEYRTMKGKQIVEALNEAVPLQHPTLLHEAMRYTLLADGKRAFPVLCIAACELVGGNESSVMPMACALEMVGTMVKIQDDLPCIDNDDLRRGKPANHKVFGEGATVLACQSLFSLAIEHFSTKTENLSPEAKVRAIVELCSALGSKGLSAGQMEDITSEGKELSLSELEFIHMHKTGKLVEASLICGIIVGGGNEVEIERLRKYGKFIGLAFQVWDDVLDATGSTAEMGKKTGRDLARDKATYPKFMGVDESKKFVNQLVAQAQEELAYFDSTNAAPLYHMAKSISFPH